MLLDRDSAVQKSEAAKFYHQSCECNPVLRCVWEALPFLIVDVTFYRQQHLFQVRSQPPSSGKFACLAIRKSASLLWLQGKMPLLCFLQAVLVIKPI